MVGCIRTRGPARSLGDGSAGHWRVVGALGGSGTGGRVPTAYKNWPQRPGSCSFGAMAVSRPKSPPGEGSCLGAALDSKSSHDPGEVVLDGLLG